MCFVGFFHSLKNFVEAAGHNARCKDCPSKSCLCTDCLHQDIYSKSRAPESGPRGCSTSHNHRVPFLLKEGSEEASRRWKSRGKSYRDPTRFDCQLWGVPLNRCRIAWFLQVTKLGSALVISRKSWWRLLGFVPREGATPLDLCVMFISFVNALTSLHWLLPQEPNYFEVIAYSYGMINFAFIAASMSMLMLIHTELWWSCTPIVSNFTALFLVTALTGQLVIFILSRAIGLSAEDAAKQQFLFYAFDVLTGAGTAAVGFALCRGNEGPVAVKSFELLCVSLCWLFVVLAWLVTSHWDEELMAKTHLLRIFAQRVCNFWKMHLMVWFSEHSIQCNLLRGRLASAVPWGMRAAKVAERMRITRVTMPHTG